MKQIKRNLIAFFMLILLQNTALLSVTQAAEILPKMQTILQSDAVKTAVGETLTDWGRIFLRNFAGSLGCLLYTSESGQMTLREDTMFLPEVMENIVAILQPMLKACLLYTSHFP